MQFSLRLALFALGTSVASAQTTHNVLVGASGLTFSPSEITAAIGDVVNFEFHPKNHTLTQSTFKTPCTAMAGGVTSGFMPVSASTTSFPVFSFKVNQVTPLWFYCQQTGHCAQGMVMAINVNASSPNTFDAFVANAKASASTSTSNSTTSAGGAYGSSAGDGYGAPAASGMVTSAAATSTGVSGSTSATASSGSARQFVAGASAIPAILISVLLGVSL